jgi:16S rRNA (uracil1498-N3)-methyltransferase
MPGQSRIFLSESEKDTMLKDVLKNCSGAVTLAFGPEGGWTEQEIAKFVENGWRPASLGRTILRSETAAIAAVAIAAALLSP